jgi:hypothetical protein
MKICYALRQILCWVLGKQALGWQPLAGRVAMQRCAASAFWLHERITLSRYAHVWYCISGQSCSRIFTGCLVGFKSRYDSFGSEIGHVVVRMLNNFTSTVDTDYHCEELFLIK